MAIEPTLAFVSLSSPGTGSLLAWQHGVRGRCFESKDATSGGDDVDRPVISGAACSDQQFVG
jgi:hypothetical protein